MHSRTILVAAQCLLAVACSGAALAADGPIGELSVHLEKSLPPATRGDWAFGVMADPHVWYYGRPNNEAPFRKQLQRWASAKLDFGIILGDFGGGKGSRDDAAGQVTAFKKILGEVKGRPPVVAVCGNHDWFEGAGKFSWFDAIYPDVLRHRRSADGTGSDIYLYYSFDAGGCHFVALDAGRQVGRKVYAETVPEVQLDWLKRDLAANLGKPTVILLHEPVATVKGKRLAFLLFRENSGEKLMRLVERFPDVKYLIHGHVHRDYQYRWRGKTIIITCLNDLAFKVSGKKITPSRIGTLGKLTPIDLSKIPDFGRWPDTGKPKVNEDR